MSAVLPKLLHLQAWGRRHSASLKTARPFHREPDPMPAVDSIHPKQGTVSTAPSRTSGRSLQQNTHSPHTLLGAAQKHTTGAGLEREEPNTHKLLAGSSTPHETRSQLGHLYSDAAPAPASCAATTRRRRPVVVRAKIREIFMPALSSTMTEGKIVSWTTAEGDRVSKGDPVVVVESDKADMDVETFHDGIIAAVLVPAGGTALVGAPIALLAESEEDVALAQARAQALSKAQGEETPPPHAAATAPPTMAPAPATVTAPTNGIAKPHAKKLAKQHRVDISNVVGTGPNGRITAADVEAVVGIQPKPKAAPPPPPAARSAPPAGTPLVTAVRQPGVLPPVPGATVVPFTSMQSAVSRNMVESLSVPTFRVGYAIKTDKLDALYEKVSLR